ncbi:glutamate-rich protein 6B [Rhinoderma darwinii]|uniref:glutamate-rich protein 6B n=1 Tax=Rhinoderma darwinii TaxID=43563 RepID=UPI003F67183C
MSNENKSNQIANRCNLPIKEEVPCLSNLTVENVTKLELEYHPFDGERRKVEDYIKKNQQSEELKRSTGLSAAEIQEQDLVKSGTNTTVEDPCKFGDRNETQTEFLQCGRETSSKSEKRQMTNVRKLPCKNVQTQTDCNRHYKANGSKNGSVTSEKTVKSRTSDFEHDGTKTLRQLPLSCEDDPPREMEAILSICEFCNLPKKTLPSIEKLASEPGNMLFCCMKIQEIFQYMVLDTIESYTPEKTEEAAEDEQTPAHVSEEMKALCELREQIKKTDTKEYITYLANHLNTHGSLFMMEKISFTLESATDNIATDVQSNDTFSDQAHNIDDFFVPNMDDELIKKPRETIKQCYNSGQNFLILFPDGTGQVLYPSGNIGILIACSKPTQFTFIILEDAEKNPQIQAVFMSNGHAACYHLNGMLWTVLDPCGGSYFEYNGAQKKHWTWWDFSQHVHAPPFQPINLMLNSNIEVKMLKQDQVYLSFKQEKEKVTFNVGSKLVLKDPERTPKMKWSTGEDELYCSSKKLEIFRLLNKIRKRVRISAISQDREKMIQDYIYQLQKSLDYIIALINKEKTSNIHKTKIMQEIVTAVKKKPGSHPSSTLSYKTDLPNFRGEKGKKPTHSSNKPKIKLAH